MEAARNDSFTEQGQVERVERSEPRESTLRRAAAAVIAVGVLSLTANVAITATSDRVGWGDTGWPWQAVTAAFLVAGALIALSRPTHPIGWLFLGIGMLEPLVETIVAARLHLAGDTPSWWFIGPEAVITAVTPAISLVLLLFPTGGLPSRGWRLVVALPVAAMLVGATSALLNGGWGGDYPNDAIAASPLRGEFAGLGESLPGLFFPLLTASFVAGSVSLVVRYRRSRGEERLQLRWLAAAAALLVLAAPLYTLGDVRNPIVTSVFVATLCLIPLAAGIAVVRYRLYDIDVVVNRALVYGGLTATLAAAYLASVLLLQLVLSPLTERSDLAIAGSTLAVAALFRPARERIQAFVDHRFYRDRYDAARTLEAFSGRLRDQFDLEALGMDLRNVVQETVQPAHVSLWLREAR